MKIETVYPHPREKVWRVIAAPELVSRWLMETNLEPVVGHEFTFRTDPQPGWNGIVWCKVVVAEEPRALVYTWSGSWGESLVRWTLEPVTGGTKVTLEHSGFTGMRGMMLSFILGSGWKRKLTVSVPALLDKF